MSETPPPDPPSPFIERSLRLLATLPGGAAGRRQALDVAMGRGRHTRLLADAGWQVFGVDANFAAVRLGLERASASGLRPRVWCADLTMFPLPASRFDLIIVSRYLQRDLFPALRDALRPGGVMIYETFTTEQRTHDRGPKSPDHLLTPGELPQHFPGFEILLAEEVTAPDAYARFCGRKPA